MKALKEEWEERKGGTVEHRALRGEQARELEWKKNALWHSFISCRLAEVQAASQVALEAGNSPQMIFKHYRELVRPNDAKSWFSITPATDGKILYLPADDQGTTERPRPLPWRSPKRRRSDWRYRGRGAGGQYCGASGAVGHRVLPGERRAF